MATVGQLGGLGLMRPQAGNTVVRPARNQSLVNPVRPPGLTGLTCGNVLHMGDTLATCGNIEQAIEGVTRSEGRG
ncbi:hypothetical protein GCM10009525_04310 [Streptosporangium amethystogenes subsp. fukuiense]